MFGIGDAMLVNARLGNSPWTVLAEGVARHTPLDIGDATVAISMVVLLLWFLIDERPGLGTIANALIIGFTVKFATRWLPEPDELWIRIAMVILGVVIVGVGGAAYLSTQHGPGPRDGLMTGLARRLGKSLARVRTVLEVSALTVGALLGGRVGFGTLWFALAIGPTLAAVLAFMARRPALVAAADSNAPVSIGQVE